MLPVAGMNSTSLESLSANALRRRFGAGVIGAIYLALLLVSLSVFIAGPGYAAEPNLLLNGDLSKGSTDRPDHWIRAPFASQKLLKWSRPAGEPASLEVERVKGLFRHTSYWSQTVNLAQPGWYHLRAEVKTDDADTSAAIKVEGAHETEVVTQSNQQWAPDRTRCR